MSSKENQTERPECGHQRFAQFPSEETSGRAYFEAQEAIRRTDCDMSAFRLQLDRNWHVALLGRQPPEDLDSQLEEILAIGEAIALSPRLVDELCRRRRAAVRTAPWVETHFRPEQRGGPV